jgi:hypothetical protein
VGGFVSLSNRRSNFPEASAGARESDSRWMTGKPECAGLNRLLGVSKEGVFSEEESHQDKSQSPVAWIPRRKGTES